MRKRLTMLIFIIVLVVSGTVFIKLETVTRVGMDYKVQTLKIPLYLKILNFYSRHFNYQWLIERVIEDSDNDEDKVIRLLNWTLEHIKQQPESLPVMDEHVWSVIVRGYGVPDNFNDVFTTLCNYAEVNAYFITLNNGKDIYFPVSLVQIEGKWTVMDPYNGVYFRNSSGNFAGIQDIKTRNMKLVRISDPAKLDVDYNALASSIPNKPGVRFSHANTQSPSNRLMLQVERRLRGEELIESYK